MRSEALARQLPSWSFFGCYFLLACVYAVVMPPFRGPDERNHFLRSYEISELRFFPHRLPDGFVGDELPIGLSQLSDAVGEHTNNRMTADQLAIARTIQLQTGNRVVTEFSNSALYAPGGYLPSASAIALGRAVGLRPFYLLYLARAANVIAASILAAFAFSRAGAARIAAAIAMLLPMAVSQTSLVTADAMTFAFSSAWIGFVFCLAVERSTQIGARSFLGLVAGAFLLSQLRPPYPLLAFLIFVIPRARCAGWKNALLIYAAVVCLTGIPALLWSSWAAPQFVPEPRHDTVAQIAILHHHPKVFLRAMIDDFALRGADRWNQAVGRFGWLNIPTPAWLSTGYAIVLLVGCALGTRDSPLPRKWQRAVMALTAVGGVLAIELLLFVSYDLGWIQGRYFIPFIVVATFAAVIRRFRSRVISLLCFAFVGLAHLVSFFAIADASWM